MSLQLHAIRGTLGFSFLVTEKRPDKNRAILFDACLGCAPRKLAALFAKLGLRPDALCAIQLTHAHIDHCVNAAALQRWSGAPVYCPVDDKAWLLGRARYRGLNKIGGALEAVGRFLWRYEAPADVRYFVPPQEPQAPETLPHFDAIQAIALPGHTPGHTGYWIPATGQLIAGDLFAEIAGLAHAPPRIFTDDRPEALRSIAKAAALEPSEVFVCHVGRADGARASGARGSATLRKLASRHARAER